MDVSSQCSFQRSHSFVTWSHSFVAWPAPKYRHIDDPVFYHKATKMIITGHHWEFSYMPKDFVTPEELKNKGGWVYTLLIPLMTPKGGYDSAYTTLLKRFGDPKIHAAQWGEVMKWDFEYGTGHHDPPGMCGPIDNTAVMKGEGGLKGHFKRKLKATGELTGEPVEGSWLGWRYPNAVAKWQVAEPGFVKKYGKVPVLRMGGPGYDAYGLKK
jgi:hypothetical protein